MRVLRRLRRFFVPEGCARRQDGNEREIGPREQRSSPCRQLVGKANFATR
jgi:hypothetical protein